MEAVATAHVLRAMLLPHLSRELNSPPCVLSLFDRVDVVPARYLASWSGFQAARRTQGVGLYHGVPGGAIDDLMDYAKLLVTGARVSEEPRFIKWTFDLPEGDIHWRTRYIALDTKHLRSCPSIPKF